jgi:hypothetical protein
VSLQKHFIHSPSGFRVELEIQHIDLSSPVYLTPQPCHQLHNSAKLSNCCECRSKVPLAFGLFFEALRIGSKSL